MNSADLLHRLTDGAAQLAVGTLSACMLGRLVPRLHASWRCWLWRLAAVAAFLATLCVLPVRHAAPSYESVLRQSGLPAPGPDSRSGLARASASDPRSVSSGNTSRPAPDREGIVLAVWLLGSAAGASILGLRIARTFRFTRRVAALGMVDTVAGTKVVRSDSVPYPMVVNPLRPTILLPTQGDTEVALAHELAHVRRRDLLWDAFVGLAASVFWPCLLAWLAVREHRQTCEEACDDLVLRSTGIAPARYATALLEFATRPLPRLAGLGTAASDLPRRIRYMNRSRLRTRQAILAIAPAILLLVPARLVADQATGVLDVPTVRSTMAKLILRGEFRNELKLSTPQTARLVQIDAKAKAEVTALYSVRTVMKRQGLSIDERVQRELEERTKIRHEATDDALQVLTEPQAKRLREVTLQYMRAFSVLDPEVRKSAPVSEGSFAKLIQMRDQMQRELLRYERAEIEAFDQPIRFLPQDERPKYLDLAKRAIDGRLSAEDERAYRSMRRKIEAEMSLPHAEVLAEGRVETLQLIYFNHSYEILEPEELSSLRQLWGKQFWVQTNGPFRSNRKGR